MTLNDKIKYLSTPLPEDIQSCIQSGFFDQAISLIDSRLASGCPEALQGRLELGKIRLIPLPGGFSLFLSPGAGPYPGYHPLFYGGRIPDTGNGWQDRFYFC